MIFVPQPAFTSADRLENKCLKSHNVRFFQYPDTGTGSETVIKHLWLSVEKYVGNYITLECFALNKITCFNFGRGWRRKHCGETFSQLVLVRNAIAEDLSTVDSTQTNKVFNSKQKVLKCPLGCDRGIRGAVKTWPAAHE